MIFVLWDVMLYSLVDVYIINMAALVTEVAGSREISAHIVLD